MKRIGTVYLVGAGPGDPELLTLKAVRLLRLADVVVYDHLVSLEILDRIDKRCERIYVGKEDGFHYISQEAISALLVDLALAGKTVVRLKGGDPLVFGRGGEEMITLRKAGVPYEVVPGVTSAVGALAYAGIPITHRGLSASFAVITGHRANESSPETAWRCYAGIGTLVFLMGVRHRQEIARQLIEAGRPEDEPVAFVENGCTPQQRVVLSTLGRVAEDPPEVETPALFVVGRVAELHEQLAWFRTEQDDVERSYVFAEPDAAGARTS